MSNRPSFKVTEEEYKQLKRMKAIEAENTQKNRLITMRKNNQKIDQFERMVSDKKDQIAKKDYRERSETFVSGKKPEFMLLNEVDEITGLMTDLKETDASIKEEYEKTKK